MTPFEYLSTLTAVVIGLTIVHILEGFSRIISDPERHRIYWVHALWGVWLLIFSVFFWWFEFALVKIEVWNFAHFSLVLLYAATLYYMAVVLFPRDHNFDGDYKKHFYRRRGWLMAGFILSNIVDIPDTLSKGHEHTSYLGIEYILVIVYHIIIGLIGWRWANNKLHGIIIVSILIWQISLILRLYGTLSVSG